MKNSLIFTFGVLILLLSMIITKPSDQACIDAEREWVAGVDPMSIIYAELTVNRYTVHVVDHVFYKTVYGIDGRKIGTGIFSHVFIQ